MINDDEPIQGRKEDLLGRESIADRIVDVILKRPTAASLVVALHGPWGDGKSSVLSMVRESLVENSEVVCVRFDAWLFNDVEQLIRSFFSTISTALERAGAPKELLKKALNKFGGILTFASQVAGREVDFSAFGDRTPSEIRDDLFQVTSKLGKRVVVLVDDVDRLPPDELVLMLKLVRLCSNFPYFTYLLAFDRVVVSKTLRDQFSGESEFLDKIVQVEVPLPPIPLDLIGSYVAKGLDELGRSLVLDVSSAIEIFKPEPDEIVRFLTMYRPEKQARHLVDSLRDAKRFLNGIACTLPVIGHEVDPADFVRLELLRVFFPTVYDTVYVERFSFAALDSRLDLGERKERQQLHRAFADKVRGQPKGELALKLLTEVFPVFRESLAATNTLYGQSPLWTRLMKACDPAHVDRYFQLRLPANSVPRRIVRDLIGRVNEMGAADIGPAIVAALNEHRGTKRIGSFLDGLRAEADTIGAGALPAVIQGLAQGAEALDDSGDLLFGERNLTAGCMALLGLTKRLARADAELAIAAAIKGTPRLEFALQMVYLGRPGSEDKIVLGHPDANWGALAKTLQERIEKALAVPGVDIFSAYANDWDLILRLWAEPNKAAAYLAALFVANPTRWRTLAEKLVEPGFEHGEEHLNLRGLATRVDLEALALASASIPISGVGDGLLQVLRDELMLVPSVMKEVHDMSSIASALLQVEVGMHVNASWTTPVWDRTRARIEGSFASQAWWPQLVRVYELFQQASALAREVAEVGSPGQAMDAVSSHSELQRVAAELQATVGRVEPALQAAIGRQAPVRLQQ